MSRAVSKSLGLSALVLLVALGCASAARVLLQRTDAANAVEVTSRCEFSSKKARRNVGKGRCPPHP